MRNRLSRTPLVIGMVAAITLGGLSLAAASSSSTYPRFPTGTSCSQPKLPGSVVRVALVDMGGHMMGGMMSQAPMRLMTDRSRVRGGTVSFAATNFGSRTHEMLVLPLSSTETAGTRSLDVENKVDESTSVGEASKACGAGAGDGITPGTSGRLTLNLAKGRYELICNLEGHYAAGMYSELTVY